jgi:hypothetical protein
MRRTNLGVAALIGGALLAGCEGSNQFPDEPLGTGGGRQGSIAGQVTAGGSAVVGAEVSVGTGSVVRTDAAGQYRIDGLQQGTYRVLLLAPPGFGFAPGDSAARRATVVGGQTVIVSWQLLQSVGAGGGT